MLRLPHCKYADFITFRNLITRLKSCVSIHSGNVLFSSNNLKVQLGEQRLLYCSTCERLVSRNSPSIDTFDRKSVKSVLRCGNKMLTAKRQASNASICGVRYLHIMSKLQAQKRDDTTALAIKSQFFESMSSKNKQTFVDAIEIFENRGGERRGHVEFIYAAMNYLEEFGVHKDLETYKKLMDVFPKGKFIPTNMFQMEFMHYPMQQNCAIDLLDKMEGNGVLPDREMGEIINNIFGKWSHPKRKFMRIMYWMPKFKHLSPWPLPNPVPFDPFELARLAISRICTADLQSKITIFQTKDLKEAVDDTWIISGQSPTQQQLLEEIKPEKKPAFVEGPFQIFIRQHMVNYFILRTDTVKPPDIRTKDSMDDVSNISLWMFGEEKAPVDLLKAPSVHEQEDGIILATCATGTSSHNSLLSWIRFLQDKNPHLAKIPVVFTLRVLPFSKEIVPVNASEAIAAKSTENGSENGEMDNSSEQR